MKVKKWPNNFLWMSVFLLTIATFCEAAPTRRSRRSQASTQTRTYNYSNYRPTSQQSQASRSYATAYAQPTTYSQPAANYTVAQANVVLPTMNTTPGVVSAIPVATTSMGSVPASSGSAMAEVNAIRAKSGLPAFIEDPSLSAVAYQKASIQANRSAMHHPGGSMGGARYEGVGMGMQFASCYLYSNIGQYAGAATVVGSSGQRYHCLLIK